MTPATLERSSRRRFYGEELLVDFLDYGRVSQVSVVYPDSHYILKRNALCTEDPLQVLKGLTRLSSYTLSQDACLRVHPNLTCDEQEPIRHHPLRQIPRHVRDWRNVHDSFCVSQDTTLRIDLSSKYSTSPYIPYVPHRNKCSQNAFFLLWKNAYIHL